MNPLIAVAIEQTPALIAMLKSIFARQHPDQPTPTDDEVIAAYQTALSSSLARDAAWLAAHPE